MAKYSSLLWLLRFVTGAALIPLLLIHVTTFHLDTTQQLFDAVVERLKDVRWVTVEATLIAIVAFHAFNGIYSIICDINLPNKIKRAAGYLLIIMYGFLVTYGVWVLTFFLR